jgi:hypothetical protein
MQALFWLTIAYRFADEAVRLLDLEDSGQHDGGGFAATRQFDVGLLAMQKAEGSSPVSRVEERPAPRVFPRLPARFTHRAGRHFVGRVPG